MNRHILPPARIPIARPALARRWRVPVAPLARHWRLTVAQVARRWRVTVTYAVLPAAKARRHC